MINKKCTVVKLYEFYLEKHWNLHFSSLLRISTRTLIFLEILLYTHTHSYIYGIDFKMSKANSENLKGLKYDDISIVEF